MRGRKRYGAPGVEHEVMRWACVYVLVLPDTVLERGHDVALVYVSLFVQGMWEGGSQCRKQDDVERRGKGEKASRAYRFVGSHPTLLIEPS